MRGKVLSLVCEQAAGSGTGHAAQHSLKVWNNWTAHIPDLKVVHSNAMKLKDCCMLAIEEILLLCFYETINVINN